MKIWLVGKLKHNTIHGPAWDLISLNASKEEAIKNCLTVEYFYMELELNKNYENSFLVYSKTVYPKG